MRTRVMLNVDRIVKYDRNHWELLKYKREIGVTVLKKLDSYGVEAFIFGSVARGDVHKKSDVEIIIPNHRYINKIEIILDHEFGILEKIIVMATPNTAMKVNYILLNEAVVVIPFVPLSKLELEFYKFGGKIDLPQALNYKNRVPGVNKNYCLIIPLPDGHREVSVYGREKEVANILNVDVRVLHERRKYLMKRDEKGRTGLYLKVRLDPQEDVFKFVKKLMDEDPAIRRHFRSRGLFL